MAKEPEPRSTRQGSNPLDLTAETDEFFANKLRTLEEKRVEIQDVAEELHLKQERMNQDRRAVLLEGNGRTMEIIQESGLREILEEARIALVRHYPSTTLAERADKGRNADDSKNGYIFRLGWKPVPENARINIWDPHDLGDGQEFHFFDVTCSGWKQNVNYDSGTRTIDRQTVPNNPIVSYERRDSLVISCGLPGGIEFLDGEWRDPEKLKQAVVKALKNPFELLVPYVLHSAVSVQDAQKRQS